MHRFLDFELKKELKLWPLALNQTFRGIAVSLLSLFSSVYIFQVFSEVTGQKKLAYLAVFVFFSGLYIFKFIANLFAEEIARRLGLKRPIYLGLLSFIFCFVLMYFSQTYPWLVFLAGPFWGLATGLYWFSSHGIMVKLGRDGHFGKESALVNVITTLPLVFVPFLGGVLIRFSGYHLLYAVSLFFILLSVLAIYRMKEVKIRHNTDMFEVFNLFKTHQRAFWAYIGDTVAAVTYSILIPLHLFLILGKEMSL